MLYRYIPWTSDLVCILLNLVITEGAHIAGKSDVTKKWSAVNDAFFNQNEARLFKDELYKKGDFRKINSSKRWHQRKQILILPTRVEEVEI